LSPGIPDLAVDLCGIELEHPVLNGSGTFDAIAARRAFGSEVDDRFPFSAFVSKTITPQARDGNPPPRLWETPAGMINSIGLPNKGLEGFLREDLPQLATLPVPLIVSVMATSHDSFAEMVEAVADQGVVAGIELNVSCPNVESGLTIGAEPGEAGALMTRLRPITEKPLIVKLTPNANDPAEVARAAAANGADAFSLVNTLRAMALDPRTLRPWLGGERGGLSGPAVRAVALSQVSAVAAAVPVPIVGMGGIANGLHALEFLAAGATAVAVGTESFRDPAAGLRVASELGDELAARSIPSPAAARGAFTAA
jgi:dihydroorotate dehydrogenase (NAD+) catalytic subunit